MEPEKQPTPTPNPAMRMLSDILPRSRQPRLKRSTEPLDGGQPTATPVKEPAPVVTPAPALPTPVPTPKPAATSPPPPPATPQSIELPKPGDMALEEPQQSKPKLPKKILILLAILIGLAVLITGGIIATHQWYQTQLLAVTTDKNAARIRVTIVPGSTPEQIGILLKEKRVIRDAVVFTAYTREKGVQSKLQAGTFSLKPSDPLPVIVEHLVLGKTDEFSITFLPGDTLAGHRQVLIKSGYSAAEVDAAFKKQYDHPLFAGKPSSADLEGYIYGETYNFFADATVEQILTRTFDEYMKQVKAQDLVNVYQKQGLNLFQGITLASIIQREVANETDEKQVAQVFLKRLKEGGVLGSDVTFIYAAKKLGVEATPTLESPYNTRIHPGLPPGPISSPGLSALQAVANPAAGDYTYFLAGDDGKTYFAHTFEEHEANIVNHCQKNCR
jgi:UPF0755 protein